MSTQPRSRPNTPQLSKKEQLIETYVGKLKAAATADEIQQFVNDYQLYGEHLRRFTISEESILNRAIRDARARVEKSAKKKPTKAERIDRALREALSMHDHSEERWQKLIAAGASDDEIFAHLIDEFGSGIGSSTADGIQFAVRGLSPDANHVPVFWLDSSTHMTTQKPTLKGNALLFRVRELLSIPQPTETEVASGETPAPAELIDCPECGTPGTFRIDEDDPGTGTCHICFAHLTIKPPAPVTEVFYALDVFPDGSHDVTYLGADASVDVVEQDQTAVIGVSASGEMRVVSLHNSLHNNASPEDVLTKYGGDARLLKPHKFREGDAEDEPPCCDLQEFEPIHILSPETQSDGLQAQAETVTADATPVMDASPVAEFSKEIEVELSDHDIAIKAREASVLTFQIEELEAEKKETDGTYKRKIGGLEEERDKLMREIRRGRATLELKVVERRDYGRKVVEYLRSDTLAVVESRPLIGRELQRALPIV